MAKKEKQSKWGIFWVVFISFIMVSSVIGFLYGGEKDQFKYKQFKFKRTAEGWSTTINDKQIAFNYLPTEVEPINLTYDITSALINKPEIDSTSFINDTFSEEIALAQYSMALALNNFNVYLRQGFSTNNTFNLPIITCQDATLSVPVIYFKQSNETKIVMQNNCIIAEAKDSFGILRIKDRLLYSILGIIG